MIKTFKSNYKYLEIPDVTNQLFLVMISVFSLIFVERTPERFLIPVINVVLCILIVYFVSHYEKKTENEKRQRSVSRFLRFWYPVLMILFCFKEIYLIMISLNHGLYDEILLKADYLIFGMNPTQFLAGYLNPYAVEFFQIVYGVFYLMPVIYALELYLWHRYDELKYAMFVILFGFYLSFIGYVIIPAVGPRFTLHEFHLLNTEMPGLFFAEKIRDFINFVESIPVNVPDPEAYAQRDAFPSGHTIIILLITYLSHKIKSNSFYFYLPYSMLMLFSTVYLRYHYVIDLIGGIPVVLITIYTANKIYGDRIDFGKQEHQ
ncbi:MAG: phosphatase PAP2 family protein [Ignavibacteria bacterium]|nr:phosphatase PAP2 family protein [Ignavibacteria bacterium]